MKRTTPDLRNRTVVITGASAGVGRAVALCFARSGATLGLIARDAAALDEVKQEVEKLGGNALVLPADVADANAVFEAADTIASARGGIDIWINDAMVTVFAPVWEIAPQEFRRVTEVTYLGMVHGTMAALRHMRARNRGTIVQVGSALALSRHSAAGRLLRRQARAARLHQFAAYRTRSRQLRDRCYHRRTAGSQHAAIRLGAHPHAAPAASGPPGCTAGGRCRHHLPRCTRSEA